MVGMAVDANVLIYERLREERDRGRSLALAIRNGYDRAFPTIIDTHLSSIFTAIVLYIVGNDQLKGFGISLTVGLIISLFTSLYMTRVIFDFWLARNLLHKLSMFRLFSRPNIDFMAIRYYWFTATIFLTIVGAALFIYHLDKGGLNIDFRGGTAYGGVLAKPMDIKELRSAWRNPVCPTCPSSKSSATEGAGAGKSYRFTVRTTQRDPGKSSGSRKPNPGDDLKKILLNTYSIAPNNKEVSLEFVDDSTSKKPAFASRAQVSIILSRKFKAVAEELKNNHEDAMAISFESAAQQFVLEGLGKENDGRFQWMRMRLPEGASC